MEEGKLPPNAEISNCPDRQTRLNGELRGTSEEQSCGPAELEGSLCHSPALQPNHKNVGHSSAAPTEIVAIRQPNRIRTVRIAIRSSRRSTCGHRRSLLVTDDIRSKPPYPNRCRHTGRIVDSSSNNPLTPSFAQSDRPGAVLPNCQDHPTRKAVNLIYLDSAPAACSGAADKAHNAATS